MATTTTKKKTVVPKSLKNQAKRNGVKLTVKRGNRRVPKSAKVLKTQIKNAKKKKVVKSRKRVVKKRKPRKVTKRKRVVKKRKRKRVRARFGKGADITEIMKLKDAFMLEWLPAFKFKKELVDFETKGIPMSMYGKMYTTLICDKTCLTKKSELFEQKLKDHGLDMSMIKGL